MQDHNTLWRVGTDHAGIATQMLVGKVAAEEGKTRHDLGRRGLHRQGVGWKHRSGSPHHPPAAPHGRQRRLVARALHHGRRLLQGGAGSLRALVQRGADLPRQAPGQLGSDPAPPFPISGGNRDQQGQFWHFRYPLADGVKTDAGLDHLVAHPPRRCSATSVCREPGRPRYASLVGKFVGLPLVGRRIPIVADEHADMEGSGCVKITPPRLQRLRNWAAVRTCR
ncbi:hypothetical protein DSL92_03290 [Billgrantia gudaonensis]|uniref:valine--tRNA ligase n=1 Tax=Billgrantia gudaonensis TaxID=376427 RepID=A0A3S0VT16_9GAMM|nr:hypothetical protein DSL92_03290 [Halomonas gudaonensis]